MKEMCTLKGKKGSTIHIKKGERLLRSIRQLLELNYQKLRSKVGCGSLARHLECIVMAKDSAEGEELFKLQTKSQNDKPSQPAAPETKQIEEKADIDDIFAEMNAPIKKTNVNLAENGFVQKKEEQTPEEQEVEKEATGTPKSESTSESEESSEEYKASTKATSAWTEISSGKNKTRSLPSATTTRRGRPTLAEVQVKRKIKPTPTKPKVDKRTGGADCAARREAAKK